MKWLFSLFGSQRGNTAKAALSNYTEGLHRVASVIDQTPDYHKIMTDSLSSEERLAFAQDVDLSSRRSNAIDLARKAIELSVSRVILPTLEGIAFEGKTENNMKEFRFLQSLCAPANLDVERNNYSHLHNQRKLRIPDSLDSLISSTMMEHFSAYINARQTVEAGLVHQLILYSRYFKSTLIAFLQKDAVQPRLLVQANDHSPIRVAFSVVMKSLGVPRLYLQHAQVSPAFPPLDYEFSVLYNERSLQTYRSIAPTTGQIFVIGREVSDIPIEALKRDRQGPCDVVIYPTARVDMDGLQKVVQALAHNPGVQKVQIKRHPRANQIFPGDFGELQVEIIDQHPSQDHVAIVGNSSVALELVSQGTPVYQCFEIDFVTRDYYAFVQSGLIPEVSLDMLGSKFWTPYNINETWKRAYAEWIPSADQSAQNIEAFTEAISPVAKF